MKSALPSPSSKDRLDADLVIGRLKRLQAFEIQSARLLGGWLPGIARWETKHQLGLHLWQDASHSKELRTRLWELRISNPDRGLGADIAHLVQGLAGAQEDYEFLAGVYLVFKTELVAMYTFIADQTNEVFDAPTISILRRLLPEKQAQLDWARREIPLLADTEEKQQRLQRWLTYIRSLFVEIGGLAGEPEPAPSREPATPLLRSLHVVLTLLGSSKDCCRAPQYAEPVSRPGIARGRIM